jgi:hypothetical protein
MRWPWRLHREWGERAERARAEADRSRRSLEEARAKLVAPMASLADRNHFAQIIRDSLLEGRNGGRS